MIKRVWTQFFLVLSLSLGLASCGGGGGSPAPPPVISGNPGDGQVQINWTPLSGIVYWLWFTQTNQVIDINNPPNAPQQGYTNAVPLFIVGNLTNGLTTSMVSNSHAGNANGPGGPQSNDLILTPRLSATSWTQQCAANCPSVTMNAVAFGDSTTSVADSSTIHVYVAVGNNGEIYTSPDGISWTIQPSSTTSACNIGTNTLYGVASNNNTFYAVGAGGKLCYTSQTVGNYTLYGLTNVVDANNNWAPQNAVWSAATTQPNNSTTLYAVAGTQQLYNNNANNTFVAVGSAGAIWNTTDAQNWAQVFTAGNNDLKGVNYIGSCGLPNGYQWVAVGQGGVIVRTTDANGTTSWQAAASPVTTTLHGVACSPNTTLYTIYNNLSVNPPNNTTPIAVAVGDNGTVVTSTDGNTWTQQTSSVIGSDSLTSIYAINRNLEARNNNTQFVATSNTGNVYVSTDGVNWSKYTVAANTSLNAITSTSGSFVPNGNFGSVPFSYVAVGGSTSSSTGFSAISQ
ncbi:hypothetical protein LHV13_03025 [Ferrovum sp. PN-J185]|uniref:sialidase family protein n=1 Tax=Ferrovum sp. PN-J185 TaxID=1356306 RepID=UPI001E53A6A8|nr:hypothetical protein [Ferrovum sp. PN-J185]MCC6068147.1 hypothetical protein [Ferrovum sp. PN-J185]